MIDGCTGGHGVERGLQTADAKVAVEVRDRGAELRIENRTAGTLSAEKLISVYSFRDAEDCGSHHSSSGCQLQDSTVRIARQWLI